MNAIIDLGSNSVRLMLTGKSFAKMSKVTRIAEGLSTTGILCDAAMDRTLAVLEDYVIYAKQAGAHNIYIFATEAIRAAKNSHEFLKKVLQKIGIEIDVMSGNDEALCGFLGAVSGQSEKGQFLGVVDIGGASTEISIGKNNEITYSKSLSIGTVRLRDLFGLDRKALEKYIKETIQNYGQSKADKFVGIGGTFTSLSSMLMGLKQYDPKIVDNSIIKLKALNTLVNELWIKSDQEIFESYPTLGIERAKVIRYGAVLAQSIMKMLNIENITVSEKDNMEGYCIYKKIPY